MERKFKKRDREDLQYGNTEQELQHKERKKKNKKERRDEVQQGDSPSLHAYPSQAEEQRQLEKKPQHASPGESSADSANKGKSTLMEISTLNGGESEDQHFQGKVTLGENGKEEKTKKKLKNRREEVFEEGDLVKEIEGEKRAEKKKRKKGIEQLEKKNLDKRRADEPEEDRFSREEEKSEEKRRRKQKKKKKKRKMKEGEEEDSQNKKGTFMNEAESDGMDSRDSIREPIKEATNKEKKKEKNRKKVTFEDEIVATDHERASDILDEANHSDNESSKDNVEEIWGIRFTPEEDETLKDAVWTYIKSKGWDEHVGLEKVFNSNKHRDARNCWAEIKMCLPQRPRQAIRFRAHVLLESGGHLGKWSKEEEDLLKRLQSERGHKWREFSSILNRQRSAIKEKWRSLKRSDTLKKKGGWTQDEIQQLSKMVHESLRINRLLATKKEKLDRHILKENIAWEKIANTLGTHNHGPCCSKWYYNLQSSLVTDGHWANQDDFLLLESLLESGASAEEEVEWDNLLEHRSGQVCLTRWKQMVKHLGENRTRQFLNKLDILARRYAPELLETSVEDTTCKELPSDNVQAS